MYQHFYCIIAVLTASLQGFAQGSDLPLLPPMPEVPVSKAVNSVPLGDATSFQEVLLDLPIADGPFKPNWESIERNYPGTPQWLRDAKIGFWVHFGPQASGESGDWYARRLYQQGHKAYDKHVQRYGHPSEVGYKKTDEERTMTISDILITVETDPTAVQQTRWQSADQTVGYTIMGQRITRGYRGIAIVNGRKFVMK